MYGSFFHARELKASDLTMSSSSNPDPDDAAQDCQKITAEGIEGGHLPPTWEEEDRWYLSTVEGDRKKEIAPWVKENPNTGERSPPQARVSWKWDGVPTDLQTANKWLDHLPGDYFLATYLPDRAELGDDCDEVFIDADNVRCPETGIIHPVASVLLYYTDSVAYVSQSGTGLHIYVRGKIPERFDPTLKGISLPEWGFESLAGGEPEIEVYGEKRFIAFTGDRVKACGADVTRDDEFVGALYETVSAMGGGDDSGEEAGGEEAQDWQPTLDRDDVRTIDTTRDVEDIFDAIKHVHPDDIRLRSPVTEKRADGSKSRDPHWEESKSGTRLGEVDDGWVYRKGYVGLDALQVVALEEGIIHGVDEYPEGKDFWDAVDELRRRGAYIPEYDSGPTYKAALPGIPNPSEWDWRNGSDSLGEDALTIDSARQRAVGEITEIIENKESTLLNALPAMGKSYGTVKAVAETDEELAFFTSRKDLYAQVREWCEEHGLSHYTLPSMPRDCTTANGEHGQDWQNNMMERYERGVRPKTLHAYLADHLDEPSLPCQEDGACPYTSMWDFDPDDYDVLIGHYTHSYNENVVSGRLCVFDEFPEDTFLTSLGRELLSSIDHYLDKNDLPIDGVEAITRGDYTEEEKEEVLTFIGRDPEPDDEAALRNPHLHADAPLACRAMLSRHELDNQFEYSRFGTKPTYRAAYDKERGSLGILQPPDLTYAASTIALDGTPVKRMWEMVLGERLEERQVLSEDERKRYITNALQLKLIQTTPHVKTYSSGKWVNPQEDAALLGAIDDAHEDTPAAITTKNAKAVYKRWGEKNDKPTPLDIASNTLHYGAVKGTNQFADERVGCVIGSRHYGDDYVQFWGALYGSTVLPPDRSDPDNRGPDLTYGGFGDAVLDHMREHETLQSVLRFGRDAGGAAVYVHTNTLPDWVPREDPGIVVKTWSDGMEEVLDAIVGRRSFTTTEVAESVDISHRQVLNHLNGLADDGYLSVEDTGQGYEWSDEGVDELPESGDTNLEDFAPPDAAPDERDETGRTELTYTWNFASDPGLGRASEASDGGERATTDGGVGNSKGGPVD